MNLSYSGSFAEENMAFSSGVDVATESSDNLFNALAVYVPSRYAADSLTGVNISGIKTAPIAVKITSENYAKVMKGDFLNQWGDIFNGGANIDVVIYAIVFYMPDETTDHFADYLTVEANAIDFSFLTTAFNASYFCAFFKTVYGPTIDGSDANYVDLIHCLSYLCKLNPKISACVSILKVTLPLAATDTNKLLFCSKTIADESTALPALNATVSGVTTPRVAYFWGAEWLMQAQNTWVTTHSEAINIMQGVFSLYYAAKNASGTYVGNKLSLIRLTGGKIKGFGVPSIFDASVNVAADKAIRDLLDAKRISYLKPCGDDTANDCMLIGARTITGIPVIGLVMSKWIDYTMGQDLTTELAAKKTLGVPILHNEKYYKKIQDKLVDRIQTFSKIGRLTNIEITMPNFSELDPSKTDIVVQQAWTAEYVYDNEKVKMSGLVSA